MISKVPKNKSGFVLLETIVVICILCVGILSLYKTYAGLVQKINSNDLNNNAENIFKAEYIAQNFFEDYLITSDTVYVEIDLTDAANAKMKTCLKDSSKIITCENKNFDDAEQINAYQVLEVSKLYYTKYQINALTDDNVTTSDQSILLTLDGSTIDYLRSIKNKAKSDEEKIKYNLIVKTNKGTFGYYQGRS